METPIVDQVVQHLSSLPSHLQRQVLEFVKALKISSQHGVPGVRLLRFANTIPAEDLQEMTRAIEEDCEQVDPDEW